MRHLTLAIAVALLCGCMFAPAKKSSSATPVPTLEEAGSGYSEIVSASVPFNLIVSGTNVTVTVAPHQQVVNLTISGVGADVLVGSTSTVANTVTLSGAHAVLHLPAGSTIAVNVTGVGAAVFYDSSAG